MPGSTIVNPFPLPSPFPFPQPQIPTLPADPAVSAGVDADVTPGTMPGSGGGLPGGSVWGTFGDLFQFNVNWGWIMAVLFLLLTVTWVEGQFPDQVWAYVTILLLGVITVQSGFGQRLADLVGGK